jgi:hypothetical protein
MPVVKTTSQVEVRSRLFAVLPVTIEPFSPQTLWPLELSTFEYRPGEEADS